MKRTITCFLILIGILDAIATIPRKIKVEELYDNADVVAIIKIVGKNSIFRDGYSCGTIYQGKVYSAIKGPIQDSSMVEFGLYIGREVGKKYLAFLNVRGKNFDPVISTNSIHIALRREFEKRCGDLSPKYREMFHGMATLEINQTVEFGSFIILPSDLERKPKNHSDSTIVSTKSQVNTEDIVTYLRNYDAKTKKE